ncbi:MAG TPA: SLC13 family permease, partial [Mycobacterium sp.]
MTPPRPTQPSDRPGTRQATRSSLALANAVVGLATGHTAAAFTDPNMLPPQNIRTTVNSRGAKTTTYLIPEEHLPLVLPFKYLGVPKETLMKLDAILQPHVDAGYSRSDNPLTAPITVDPVNGYDPAAVTAPATQAAFGASPSHSVQACCNPTRWRSRGPFSARTQACTRPESCDDRRRESGVMGGPAAEVVALLLLAVVLLFAMLQPNGWPEATLAVPAAVIVVALGIVTPAVAAEQLRTLGPTVGFLAAILVLAHLADRAGVFSWLGARLATVSAGRPVPLLRSVFVAAALTTAVLSLDATVVLLTPVVFGTAVALGLRAKPHVYACTHLANSASTLLPVSNLTNLLAFSATGLPFLSFAAVMGLPWLAVIAVEYTVFRYFFRTDLMAAPSPSELKAVPRQPAPTFTLFVLAVTLVGFGAGEFAGIEPVWVAVAGVAVLAAP